MLLLRKDSLLTDEDVASYAKVFDSISMSSEVLPKDRLPEEVQTVN